MNANKNKRLKSLRKQLKGLSNQEEFRMSTGSYDNGNPNSGGPGGYCAGGTYQLGIMTRRARIEQAIRTINGGKL